MADVICFASLAIGDVFWSRERRFTKISETKAYADDRRDGAGPTRFRAEQDVIPDSQPIDAGEAIAAEDAEAVPVRRSGRRRS